MREESSGPERACDEIQITLCCLAAGFDRKRVSRGSASRWAWNSGRASAGCQGRAGRRCTCDATVFGGQSSADRCNESGRQVLVCLSAGRPVFRARFGSRTRFGVEAERLGFARTPDQCDVAFAREKDRGAGAVGHRLQPIITMRDLQAASRTEWAAPFVA